jgi:hypothetical protein
MANTKISALTSATTPLAGTEVLPIVQSSATVKVAVSDLTAGRSISVSGLTNTGLTASRPVFTDASKLLTSTGVVPVANGGTNVSAASITAFNNITGYTASGATGTTSTNLVFSTSPSITTPTLVGDVTVSTGNVVIGTSGKGIDFSVTSQTGGMTSELFADYEEGTWTPVIAAGSGAITSYTSSGRYTKVGRLVTVEITYKITNNGTGASYGEISGLPYTASVGCVGITRFNGTTGLSGQYSVAAGGTSGTVWNYDNTYPWATNAAGTITITYSV